MKNPVTRRGWTALAALGAAAIVALPLAAVATGSRDVSGELHPVPHKASVVGGSHVRGHVFIDVDGSKVKVRVVAHNLAPNLVHAQHIHGVGSMECPSKSDRNDMGFISTSDGLPAYGGIQVSLTTRGDTSAASGLAVNRFPVADAHGDLRYERTFTIGKNFPAAVARNLKDFQVVVHGIDANHNHMYDFNSLGISDLDPSLPQEATIPASCGTLHILTH
jgi:hypothetical protein